MPEPLSISGGVVGGVGLAFQTCSAIVDYYNSFKDAPEDIVRMREELTSLSTTLAILERSLRHRNVHYDAKAEFERVAQAINVGMENLQCKLQKIWTDDPDAFVQLPIENEEARNETNAGTRTLLLLKGRAMKAVSRSKYHTKRAIDRTKFPFRERTISQLQDVIERLKTDLLISLDICSMDTANTTLETVDSLRRGLAQIQREPSTYQKKASRKADELCHDFKKLRSELKFHDTLNTLEMTKRRDQLNDFTKNVSNVQDEMSYTKEELLGRIWDLQERVEARADLLYEDVNGVYKQLLMSTEQITTELRNVPPDLVPRIDQIAVEIDNWREEMTTITYETSGAMKALHDEVKPMQATLTNIDHGYQVQADDQFLEWLSPLTTSFETMQRTTFNLYCKQDRAGNQFLRSGEYLQWKEGSGRSLWCLGGHQSADSVVEAGVGKTVLTSSIVGALQQVLRPDEGIIYIYCKHSEAKQYHPSVYSIKLLASIARQLGSHEGATGRTFAGLRQRYAKSKDLLTRAECREAIVAAAVPYSKVFLIIDALDECPEVSRFELFEEIKNLGYKARILITSRCIYPRFYNLCQDKQVTVRAFDMDIAEYIRASTRNFDMFIIDLSRKRLLREKIVTEIVRKAAGMFLLAKLHIESLIDKPDFYSLEEALESLPDSLGSTYDEIIERIEIRDPKLAATTKKLIKWISLAMRPLAVEELQIALAVEPSDVSLVTKKIPSRPAIFRFCPELLELNVGDDTLRFVHHSAQEHFSTFFESEQSFIALSCLTYLSFEPFNQWLCGNALALEDRSSKHPLFEYACHNLGLHARSSADVRVCEYAIKFCEKRERLLSCIEVIILLQQGKGYGVFDRFESFISFEDLQFVGESSLSLILATYFGWFDLAHELLKRSTAKEMEGKWHYPFALAVTQNHTGLLRLFFDYGADVNWGGMDGSASLHVAAEKGDQLHALELLQRGSDVKMRGDRGWTPLHFAADQGDTAMIEILLTHCTDQSLVHLQDDRGRTPLHCAASSARLNAVKTLLRHGADVNASDDYRERPITSLFKFSRLVKRVNYAILQTLIENGAEVDFHNIWHEGVVYRAVFQNDLDVIRLLIASGADIDSVSWFGLTPLYIAALRGRSKVVKLLIENGAQPNTEDAETSPLWKALKNRDKRTVELLLRYGANVNQRTRQGDLPLIRMIGSSHFNLQIVELLLKAWADPSLKDPRGLTALDYAEILRLRPLIRLLLEYGAKDTTTLPGLDEDTTTLPGLNEELVSYVYKKDD